MQAVAGATTTSTSRVTSSSTTTTSTSTSADDLVPAGGGAARAGPGLGRPSNLWGIHGCTWPYMPHVRGPHAAVRAFFMYGPACTQHVLPCTFTKAILERHRRNVNAPCSSHTYYTLYLTFNKPATLSNSRGKMLD